MRVVGRQRPLSTRINIRYQTHGDYTQCTVGTFGEMKGCMPKPRRFFQWPPPPRFIDQARLILVQDQLRGEHGELSASALANVTKFSEGVAASRKADITVKDLELGVSIKSSSCVCDCQFYYACMCALQLQARSE